jgi:hypothetical protein
MIKALTMLALLSGLAAHAECGLTATVKQPTFDAQGTEALSVAITSTNPKPIVSAQFRLAYIDRNGKLVDNADSESYIDPIAPGSTVIANWPRSKVMHRNPAPQLRVIPVSVIYATSNILEICK